MVMLDQRIRGGVAGLRKSRDMEQPIERGEVGEEFLVEHPIEVELDVGELYEPRGIAEQTEEPAVGDERVEVLRQVEIFLHHCVRAGAQADSVDTLLVE